MTKTDYKLFFKATTQPIDVHLPASKSISNRALLMSTIAGGYDLLTNVAACDDTNAMQRALSEIGKGRVDIGAAGTAMRFLTAYLARFAPCEVVIDGTERMRQRPIATLVNALRQCGAHIEYKQNEGFPPLRIKGVRLKADRPLAVEGNVSSQFISALMMIAPSFENGLTIEITGKATSMPYIEMTAALMRRFGIEVDCSDSRIRIKQGSYRPTAFRIESDWSAASYWYEIKSMLPQLDISLAGLEKESLQGDTKIAEIFEQFGIDTEYTPNGVTLHASSRPLPASLSLDLSGQPDLTQTLAVTACLKGIPFHFCGIATLRIKETDRIEALISQLAKLGYALRCDGNESLIWDGSHSTPDNTPAIETFDDHRMAMAFAPAAMVRHNLIIRDASVVTKSYPDFWQHLAIAGFQWEILL